jgi:Tfp pilus assembly protein PilX
MKNYYTSLARLVRDERGVALYLTMVIMGLVFALAISASAVLLREIQITRNIARYTPALAAADAGIERALYEIRKNGSFDSCPTISSCTIGSIENPIATDGGGAYYVVVVDAGVSWCTDAAQLCIRSFGSFQGTNRALEAAF